MELIASIAVGMVAALHLSFMILEMFFWNKPLGMRVFGLKPGFAESTRALAANQGLYNGFLVAGLVWGLIPGTGGFPIQLFFLCCVVAAGLFGAITASRAILFVQAFPGAVALVLVLMAHR